MHFSKLSAVPVNTSATINGDYVIIDVNTWIEQSIEGGVDDDAFDELCNELRFMQSDTAVLLEELFEQVRTSLVTLKLDWFVSDVPNSIYALEKIKPEATAAYSFNKEYVVISCSVQFPKILLAKQGLKNGLLLKELFGKLCARMVSKLNAAYWSSKSMFTPTLMGGGSNLLPAPAARVSRTNKQLPAPATAERQQLSAPARLALPAPSNHSNVTDAEFEVKMLPAPAEECVDLIAENEESDIKLCPAPAANDNRRWWLLWIA
jgi:hypothetical protein